MCIFESTKRGFTLIELLVTIAVIGTLSSVVLASINSARTKGRDAKRLRDTKELATALEEYADSTGAYPVQTTATAAAAAAQVGTALAALSPTYLAALPSDPTSGQYYYYVSSASGLTYCIGVNLESDATRTGCDSTLSTNMSTISATNTYKYGYSFQ